MTDLGTTPATLPPEPAPETHPTRGRCSRCGQCLQRLWIAFGTRWVADRYCCDECEQSAKQQAEVRALHEGRARAVARKESAA